MKIIKENKIIILLVAFQVVLVGFIIKYASLLNNIQLLMAGCIIGVGVAIDIWVHMALCKAKEKEKMEQQLQAMKKEQQFEQENLQKAHRYIMGMEAKREEFYRTLDELYIKCQQDQEPDIIHEAYNDASQSLANMRVEKYCESAIVNAVLTSKCEEMKQYDITLKIAIDQLTDYMGIERIDLCSVFCNLIDNAIEGCKSVENDRFINVKAKIQSGYLSIAVENSADGKLIKKENGYKTTKKEATEHGYGTKILSMIAERYNGKFYIDETAGMIKAVVLLKFEG